MSQERKEMIILKTVDPLIKTVETKQSPVTIRINKFDEPTAKTFAEEMEKAHNSGQPVIPVIIDSFGGAVHSLLAMISDIRSSRLPVSTIVTGKAMSCGAILMTFGTKGLRYIDPVARVMVHQVSSMHWDKLNELEAGIAETRFLNDEIYKEVAKNCEKNETFFLDKMKEKQNADWFFGAKEAVEMGMAQHIKIPQMTRNIKVEYTFE